MFLTRATLAMGAESSDRGRIPDLSEYRIHQEIWRLFPDTPAGTRPFLYRKEDFSGKPFFLILSDTLPRSNADVWALECKEYMPAIRAGERLHFVLRANPVISRHGADGKSHRHDVIMDAKRQMRQDPSYTSGHDTSRIETDASRGWLKSRGPSHGFSVEEGDVRVCGYRQWTVRKPKALHPARISVVDFEGILEVEDAGTFLVSLRDGIGPAKGFGCGLMLVRRIRAWT